MTKPAPLITPEERRLMSPADAAAGFLTQQLGPRRAMAILSSSVGRHAGRIDGPLSVTNNHMATAHALFSPPAARRA